MKRDDLSSISGSMLSSLGGGKDDAASGSAAPMVLYGREQEMLQLSMAFQRVVKGGGMEIVIIHGGFGVGKTAMVELFREENCESSAFFCGGKFFKEQGESIEPFSTIVAAFSDLCDLMGQSQFGVSKDRKKQIQRSLGQDGNILAEAISNIAPFVLDLQDDEGSMTGSLASASIASASIVDVNARARFKVALKNFLHVVASESHPIVLFLDDIQWMDDASREWITLLLKDKIMRNVLLIMAYADEEEKRVESLRNVDCSKPCLELALDNLDRTSVHQFICGMLGSNLKNTAIRDLSYLIYAKTSGNPYHVIECVETIRVEGLLVHNPAMKKWEFDVAKIRREVMVSETLADVLLRKIHRLPRDVQETLKIASLVGFRFGDNILIEVVAAAVTGKELMQGGDRTPQTLHALKVVANAISRAVGDGLVEKTGEAVYQFSHEKLQVSFKSMVKESERERYNLHIGEGLIVVSENGSENDSDKGSVYRAAAVHLNQAVRLITSPEKRVRLAQINYEAYKFCRQKSAFVDAVKFLRCALDVLDPNVKWTQNFDLTYAITISLAKMELAIGNLEACEEMTTQALEHSKSVAMKADALLISVEQCMVGGTLRELLALSNRALKVLGVDVPDEVNFHQVGFKILKVKNMIGRKTDEALQALPRMRDRVMATAVKILLHRCMYCLFRKVKYQATYAALLATELTLKGGISPYSPSALAVYGIAELSSGNYDRGYRFGMLALKLMKQLNRKDVECPTIAFVMSSLAHWKVSMNQLVQPLDRGFRRGFQSGDAVYGAFCLANCFGIRCYLGMNLPKLQEYMRFNYQRVCDLQQQSSNLMVLWAQPSYQFVLNLSSPAADWKDLLQLNGDIMNEKTFLYQVGIGDLVALRWTVWFYKLQLACHLGYYSVVPDLLKGLTADGQSASNHFNFYLWSFYGALANYELYRRTGKRKCLTEARSFQKSLQRTDSMSNPNTPPLHALLRAEELSLKKSNALLIGNAYDEAIDAMSEAKLVHMEALANERAGFIFAEELQQKSRAILYFDRAMQLYHTGWGSITKYEWLQYASSKSLELLDQDNTNTPEGIGVVGDVIQLESNDSNSSRVGGVLGLDSTSVLSARQGRN